MYSEINAFGKLCPRGNSVRVSFDQNMGLIPTEKGASFVLEISLDGTGRAYLRQAGASSEQGLVFSGARAQVDVQIGKVIDLSQALRLQPGTVRHPQRAGTLSFQHKGYAGKTVLELNWEAGNVPVTKPVVVTPANTTDFQQARSFDKIVATALKRVNLPGGLWFPVFGSQEQALSFARYVGGYVRRVAPDAGTRSRPTWSDKQQGFIARLSVQFPGWGEEEGIVLCRGKEVAGLALEQNSTWLLLPVKQYSHTVRTESGTLYVLFEDGSAFCRSKSDGACQAADALYFARSYSEACNVQARGGSLQVSKVPAAGLVPLYISGAVSVVGDSVTLKANSFRRGTRVASVHVA